MKRTIVILSMIALALSSVFGYSWVTSQTKLTNANAHTLTARYLGGTLSCTAGGLDLGSPSYDTGETSYTASGEPDTSYTLAWVTSSGSVTPSSYQWYKDGSAIVGATSSSYTVNESEADDYVFACKAVANGVEYECNVQLAVEVPGGFSITFPNSIIITGHDNTVTIRCARIAVVFSNGTEVYYEYSQDKTTYDSMSSILGETLKNVASISFDSITTENRQSGVIQLSFESETDFDNLSNKNGYSLSLNADNQCDFYSYGSANLRFDLLGNVRITSIHFATQPRD